MSIYSKARGAKFEGYLSQCTPYVRKGNSLIKPDKVCRRNGDKIERLYTANTPLSSYQLLKDGSHTWDGNFPITVNVRIQYEDPVYGMMTFPPVDVGGILNIFSAQITIQPHNIQTKGGTFEPIMCRIGKPDVERAKNCLPSKMVAPLFSWFYGNPPNPDARKNVIYFFLGADREGENVPWDNKTIERALTQKLLITDKGVEELIPNEKFSCGPVKEFGLCTMFCNPAVIFGDPLGDPELSSTMFNSFFNIASLLVDDNFLEIYKMKPGTTDKKHWIPVHKLRMKVTPLLTMEKREENMDGHMILNPESRARTVSFVEDIDTTGEPEVVIP